MQFLIRLFMFDFRTVALYNTALAVDLALVVS
jgi:hypothetical protein